MNFKHSTIMVALIALSIISLTSIQQNAFAQDTGISISATAAASSDTILISGQTRSQSTDITIKVMSPNQNVVSVGQITPDADGNFATEIKVSAMWKENGFYRIKVEQGGSSLYNVSLPVEITNGMTMQTSVTETTLKTGFFEPKIIVPTGLLLKEANSMAGSNLIEMIGTTDSANTITIKVTGPTGNIVLIDQFEPVLDANNHFIKNITTGGQLWKQDGQYTILAKQGDDPAYTYSIEVGIKEGAVIPEFGTIAVMILAVAIISIIAVSAKSRLSIMPRY